jgi:hypothetical protein
MARTTSVTTAVGGQICSVRVWGALHDYALYLFVPLASRADYSVTRYSVTIC